jgi:hypothetical protein
MSGPIVSKWKQNGMVYLWRFPKLGEKGKGFHTTADELGTASIAELFDLMLNAQYPSKQTIQTSPVSNSVASASFNHPHSSLSSWIVRYPKGSVPDTQWILTRQADVIELVLGKTKQIELRDAFVDIKKGGGDYCLGNNDSEQDIWFWWFLGSP